MPSSTHTGGTNPATKPAAADVSIAAETARTTSPDGNASAFGNIEVVGARENNLKGVSLAVPKRRMTVFAGLSGSGKSSLVFSTIAAESRRLINETYSAFLQGFMDNLSRPNVDGLRGLSTAITVDQERLGSNPRSTVGTATDADSMLRILFSRVGEPHIGSAQAFSFNVASASGTGVAKTVKGGREVREKRTFSVTGGMCERCEGTGQVSDFDLDALYDKDKSLAEGAITIPGYSMDGWYGRIFLGSGFFDPDKPIKDYSKRELADLLYKEPTKIKVDGINLTYSGLIPRIQKSMLSKDKESMQPHIRAFVERAITFGTCPECAGTRLNERARSVHVCGLSIAEVQALQIDELRAWLDQVDNRDVAPLVASLRAVVDAFLEVGLGYLTLARATGSLSGGESQRLKMVRHLGSALTDVTYVFDEPTAGLHPHDIERMIGILRKLRDKGNTVLVVEHNPQVMLAADHVVELGPGAGSDGGSIVFEGTPAELAQADTLTGAELRSRVGAAPTAHTTKTPRTPDGQIPLRNVTVNNLQDVSVEIPSGVLSAVVGISGAGKSSLLRAGFAKAADTVWMDQAPIRGSRRSNAATYTGAMDPIRKAFAKANGVKPGLFSANSDGACEQCQGLGVIETDLGMAGTSSSVCPVCEGRRFDPSVLEYRLAGGDESKNISEVLEMSAAEGADFFRAAGVKAAHAPLQRLVDVGLGYLTLGQPLSTLSGGERQRLKLATQMGTDARVYVLDEPSAGLHMRDVEQLAALLNRLVDKGKTVIVLEHNMQVVAYADWVIELGPGAGHDGGRIVFEGTPSELAQADTLTGVALADHLEGTLP